MCKLTCEWHLQNAPFCKEGVSQTKYFTQSTRQTLAAKIDRQAEVDLLVNAQLSNSRVSLASCLPVVDVTIWKTKPITFSNKYFIIC